MKKSLIFPLIFSILALGVSQDKVWRVPHGGTVPGWGPVNLGASTSVSVMGVLPVISGGTGASVLTLNNVMLGSSTNTVQFVAPGANGNVLSSNGTTWQSVSPPALSYYPPTIQKFLSGSGTYTTSTAHTVVYIRVRMVGAGGGGSASGGAGVGTAGGSTIFGTTLLVANGGAGGQSTGNAAGGTASLGTGPIGIALQGASGGGYTVAEAAGGQRGGMGGVSPFGGAGTSDVGAAGTAAIANTGSGGGGGGATTSNSSGAGGGAGGFVDALISSPSASYPYAVGVGGTGHDGGTQDGGNGGSGIIEVTEYYQ